MSQKLGLELDDLDAMLQKQGCRHAGLRSQAAGRTAGLEQGKSDILGLSYAKDRLGSGNKFFCCVCSVPTDDSSTANENVPATATDQLSRWSRRRQASELFWTNWEIAEAQQGLLTGPVGLAAPVVAGAQTNQAATDQALLMLFEKMLWHGKLDRVAAALTLWTTIRQNALRLPA